MEEIIDRFGEGAILEVHKKALCLSTLTNFAHGKQLQYNHNGVWEDYTYTLPQLMHELILSIETKKERVRVKPI